MPEEKSEYANVSKEHHAHKTLEEHNTKKPQTPVPVHSDGTPHDPLHYVGEKGSYEKRMEAEKQRKESSFKLSSTPSVPDSSKM